MSCILCSHCSFYESISLKNYYRFLKSNLHLMLKTRTSRKYDLFVLLIADVG